MYELPSASHMRAPSPRTMNGGSPPTARNARTGEFTPPGMAASARLCNARDLGLWRSAMLCDVSKKKRWVAYVCRFRRCGGMFLFRLSEGHGSQGSVALQPCRKEPFEIVIPSSREGAMRGELR